MDLGRRIVIELEYWGTDVIGMLCRTITMIMTITVGL